MICGLFIFGSGLVGRWGGQVRIADKPERTSTMILVLVLSPSVVMVNKPEY